MDRVTYSCFDFGQLKRSKKESIGPKRHDSLTRVCSGSCEQERVGQQEPREAQAVVCSCAQVANRLQPAKLSPAAQLLGLPWKL